MAAPPITFILTPAGKLVNFLGGDSPCIDPGVNEVSWGPVKETFVSRANCLLYYNRVRDALITAGMVQDLRSSTPIPAITAISPSTIDHTAPGVEMLTIIGTNLDIDGYSFVLINGVPYEVTRATSGISFMVQVTPSKFTPGVYSIVYADLKGKSTLVNALIVS